MERKICIETDKKNIVDLEILRNLLVNAGFRAEIERHQEEHSMGVDAGMLTIIMPVFSAAIVGITSVFKVWLKNRQTEIHIKDGERELDLKINEQTDLQYVFEKIEHFFERERIEKEKTVGEKEV